MHTQHNLLPLPLALAAGRVYHHTALSVHTSLQATACALQGMQLSGTREGLVPPPPPPHSSLHIPIHLLLAALQVGPGGRHSNFPSY